MDRANPPDAGQQTHYRYRGRNNNANNNRTPYRRGDHSQDHNANANKNRDQHRSRSSGSTRQPTNRDQYSTRFFNFKRLNDLSTSNSDDVVTTLTKKKADFEELLNNIATPDLMVVTLRVLTNVSQANFAEIVTSVLSHACSPKFLKELESYLTKLAFESTTDKIKNRLYHEDKDNFWQNLIVLFKKIMELLPSKARDELTPILQKIIPITTAIELSNGYKVQQQLKNDASNMLQELEEEIKKIEDKNKQREIPSHEVVVEENPPEDFRSLSVIPTIDDLYNQKPFIRACKIKDAYDSVEHYLDVQFRLLREDFVSPLRSGIQEYLHGPVKYRNNDLRIYKNVTLIAPDVAKNSSGILISFGVLKVKWRTSKRFMFGGLLLLSRDNFNTILFVTVANRDEKELEKGFVLIEPCESTKITRDLYNTKFVMLESKIYFEPYLVVLNAMRLMRESNFPMTKYLVNADTSTSLPRYLAPGQMLQYEDFSLPIGGYHFWPSAKEMKLDETQYNAFRCALTQEFAVIQGPPGTGKTFIALKIVGTLLNNKQYWKPHGPIIVVCLTNHALDQFLEGILRHTKSIVRVGSRSKSEALKNFTLMERRKAVQSGHRNHAWPVMYEVKHELESVLSSIQRMRASLKHLTTAEAIAPLNCLQEYCHDVELQRIKSNEELVNLIVSTNITMVPQTSPPVQDLEGATAENIPEEKLPFDENIHMDDELELNLNFQVDDSDKPIFPLRSIDMLIHRLNKQILEYRGLDPEMHALPFDPTIEWEEDLNALFVQRTNLQRKLNQHPIINPNQRFPASNPRWRMYWKWVNISYENVMRKVTELERTSRRLRSKLDEAKQLVDLAVLREHDVIGLTTTGAAKQHASLRALHAPIVLVEEAAEILEAHVVCSLTKDCQHVILIGDHKQLRPKASVYKLGSKYNLNISLFERMVNIRGDCTQLAYQHRMRPQIAKLISPSIYLTLYNHQSVLDYPAVRGLVKNLFFLNHNNHENSHNNEESWTNPFEAQFLVAFARHLILQGYSGTEITILCTYTGQLFALMKETARYMILNQVRVTTVDNYQGEENRIILLSLVRNNGEGNIGFLKEENRVCVALSRAREGLYVMGNMKDLLTKNEIWPKINAVLEDEKAIGDTLELRCQIHSDQLIKIQNVSDFQQCPEGGCLKKCDADLVCGHSCTSICHTLDREHNEFQCRQACIKSCPNDHPCPLKCFEGCKPCRVMVDRQLKCGHTVQMPCGCDVETFPCYIQVDAVLPHCNHEIKKPCYQPVERCKCPRLCEIRLACGHSCTLTCHANADPDHIEYLCYKDCTKNNVGCTSNHPCKKRCHESCGECTIYVQKTRSCGHYYKKIQCAVNVEDQICERPCKRVMSCTHKCDRLCHEVCGGCKVKVKKPSPCGHTVEVKCSEIPTRSKCSAKCQRILICGHPCAAKCKEPCTLNCKVMTRRTEPGLCGHIFSVPCYLRSIELNSTEILMYCKEPCRTQLMCGHVCGGTCGNCKQGRMHISCREPCGNILVCGHKCDVPCRQECQPCKKPCEIKCAHNKCNKKCGMPCTGCKEPCIRKCEHQKCNKRCYELCNIEPCIEPCKKMLKCNHPCVGFCGDPCPPLCRICDEEELTRILFGNEDEPNARFIFLEDCGHCIESDALTTWVSKCSETIQMKTCPSCKTPIRRCMRVMNQIKKDMADVLQVKMKVFGKPNTQKIRQQNILAEILDMKSNSDVADSEFRDLKNLLQNLWDNGTFIKNQRRQTLSLQELAAVETVLKLLQEMLDILKSIKNRSVKSYQHVKNQFLMLVEFLPTQGQISTQQLEDIVLEIRRLSYMAKLCEIDDNKSGIAHEKEYDAVLVKLLSIQKFTKNRELEVKQGIQIAIQQFDTNIVQERKLIVKAMGFTQGHWFKCPNGHYYTIGECGGAMQESKCIECHAKIGGSSHRLRSDNRVATEIDGATRPAYP
ncbi:NFX1-type zinc finger-containing protein 1-like [Diprion similis]|uniref:NFX1-type zinc finger-containing protein 1-like n=1 Tax=Diprion similis TaxID=362088 RepID=UPI001EF95CFB|nr:NFX1-type zinc finger-containing protein 1-like [Diprion similis]